MKKLLLTSLLIATASAVPGASEQTLAWCGLDYSMVKMIGTHDFRHPEEIFPGMLAKWNDLFIKEMLPHLESITKSVQIDLQSVTARNQTTSANQIEHVDGSHKEMVDTSHISEADIDKAVRSYELKTNEGLGLVFIVDRLVKKQETGCTYVVFFDVKSRKVVHSERICAGAGGGGFRNYWFRPIKSAVEKLPKMFKAVKAAQ
jgi:hypothetical protein